MQMSFDQSKVENNVCSMSSYEVGCHLEVFTKRFVLTISVHMPALWQSLGSGSDVHVAVNVAHDYNFP